MWLLFIRISLFFLASLSRFCLLLRPNGAAQWKNAPAWRLATNFGSVLVFRTLQISTTSRINREVAHPCLHDLRNNGIRANRFIECRVIERFYIQVNDVASNLDFRFTWSFPLLISLKSLADAPHSRPLRNCLVLWHGFKHAWRCHRSLICECFRLCSQRSHGLIPIHQLLPPPLSSGAWRKIFKHSNSPLNLLKATLGLKQLEAHD